MRPSSARASSSSPESRSSPKAGLMPTTTLPPIAAGTYTGWNNVGGASKMASLASDNGDTSYVEAIGDGTTQRCSFTITPPAGLELVSTHTLNSVQRETAAGSNHDGFVFVRLSGADSDGSLGLTTSYATNSKTDLGSASITAAVLATAEIGLMSNRPIGGDWRATSLLWDITWTPASGGFACLVGSLAGAALGLAEMAGLARALHRRTGTLITPDEYLAAWRDIRGHRRPMTFLLGAR